MRWYHTDWRLWGTTTIALWGAYLAWDYFFEQFGITWFALDIFREGRMARFLGSAGLNGCVIPALKAALVATIVGWAAQATVLRLGRSAEPALAADFADKPAAH